MTAGLTPPAPELLERYRETHRHYHTLEHIEDCLSQLESVPGLDAQQRRILEHAIWWHDAIYDPQRNDNEGRSAELAREQLAALGEAPVVIAEVVRLIELTQTHASEPGDQLGALLSAIDLSILGRPAPAYDRYAAQVREEYGFVPEPLYRAGRAAVLKRFLERPLIYPEPGFADRYEAVARANLAREVAALEG